MKDYNFEEMAIEEIADLSATWNNQVKELTKVLDAAKVVVKSRFTDNEIGKLSQGSTGEIEIREADDFHPISPVDALKAMIEADHEDDFPLICNIQLNNSGKKAKVKKIGITHFLSQSAVDSIRTKKRKKALTVFMRDIKK